MFVGSSLQFLDDTVFRIGFSRTRVEIMQTYAEKETKRQHATRSEQTYRLVGLLLMLVGISIAMYLMDFTVAL